MGANLLLSHLDKVRRTGPDRWIACCPAHDDKGPSLAIRETDDGRVLVHCFAGCSVHEVIGAVGIDLSTLFPPRESDQHFVRSERRSFPAADVLRCIAFEALVIAAAGVALLSGHPFTEIDRERLIMAVSRIQSALTAGGLSYE